MLDRQVDWYPDRKTGRMAYRQTLTGRQTGGHTDRQTVFHTESQTYIQTDKLTDRQAHPYTQTVSQMDRQAYTDVQNSQVDRHRDMQTYIHTG